MSGFEHVSTPVGKIVAQVTEAQIRTAEEAGDHAMAERFRRLGRQHLEKRDGEAA